MSKSKQPLQIYFPFSERPNWRYWYQLDDGKFITQNYVTIHKCFKMHIHCKKLSIPFKASRMGNHEKSGTVFALIITLLVLKRLKSDKGIKECDNTNIERDDLSSSESL